MHRNNVLRGSITLQTHTPDNVVLQLPVTERAVVQTDELEMELWPRPSPAAYAGLSVAQLPEFLTKWFGPHYAGFSQMQGVPALFAGRPSMTPLDLDVRHNKYLLLQYHDEGYVGTSPTYVLDPYNGSYVYRESASLRSYKITVIIEIEELDN